MATGNLGIWLFAFGYFASYVPYSAVTKGLSKGILPGLSAPVSGLSMLPVIAMAALVGFVVVITAFGWWDGFERKAVAGIRVPLPGRLMLLSGIATAVSGIATTLAYTLEGVSIVFMMLLMRGGVLAMAPLIDVMTKRRIRPASIVALGLCLLALVAAFLGRRAFTLSAVAIGDVAFYLAAYFFRLRWMSRAGKVESRAVRKRYFVEEQLVSSGCIVVSLVLVAAIGSGPVSAEIARGFHYFAFDWRFFYLVMIGLAALGTGVFGALVLLDPRENAFAVPVNRSSSIVSGMVATLLLAAIAGQRMPTVYEWAGLGFIIGAVVLLTRPQRDAP